ncbi:MAG: hypothetical protein GXY49_00610 [Syntrophomonadaceae bacterium]|nr:hypothetical protein [Syntrophomonadaceae bacterium]
MTKQNLEIRKATKEAGLKLWQVAEAYGMTESSFSRMLRKELPLEVQEVILEIIFNLKKRFEKKGAK